MFYKVEQWTLHCISLVKDINRATHKQYTLTSGKFLYQQGRFPFWKLGVVHGVVHGPRSMFCIRPEYSARWSSSENFFTAREWNDLQTVDDRNSVRFKTSLIGEHTMYLTLTERLNTSVMIMKWNSLSGLFNVVVVVISKFFAKFLHCHKFKDRQTIDGETSP